MNLGMNSRENQSDLGSLLTKKEEGLDDIISKKMNPQNSVCGESHLITFESSNLIRRIFLYQLSPSGQGLGHFNIFHIAHVIQTGHALDLVPFVQPPLSQHLFRVTPLSK